MVSKARARGKYVKFFHCYCLRITYLNPNGIRHQFANLASSPQRKSHSPNKTPPVPAHREYNCYKAGISISTLKGKLFNPTPKVQYPPALIPG
ncbi:hypothetical protein AYI70_g3655 [Smittium culicis]|uniref:Uncharacterized protein n=1 Tax=Smittium culicis TaxID=133412 RepID=A0A1R1Y2J1_9FUNG|nr:hypothetical protein AYI70_g3655 [Smittium culicis]